MSERKWLRCDTVSPPLDTEIMTKIDDADGCRNEQSLKLHQRSPDSRPMWFFPDMSMYVYYTTTHWSYL